MANVPRRPTVHRLIFGVFRLFNRTGPPKFRGPHSEKQSFLVLLVIFLASMSDAMLQSKHGYRPVDVCCFNGHEMQQ